MGNLKTNPKNPNTHPPKQIKLLAKILAEQGWRAPIVVSNLSGYIIKGHGRLQAAKLAGFDKVPVDYQDYASPAEELADMIADNKIAEFSELDSVVLKDLIEELDTGEIDLKLTGFDEHEIEMLVSQVFQGVDDGSGLTVQEDESFCPALRELVDDTHANQLIQTIQKTNASPEIKDFLIQCALRHRIFNYNKIATYYKHSNEEIKNLFELVVCVQTKQNQYLKEQFDKANSGNIVFIK